MKIIKTFESIAMCHNPLFVILKKHICDSVLSVSVQRSNTIYSFYTQINSMTQRNTNLPEKLISKMTKVTRTNILIPE